MNAIMHFMILKSSAFHCAFYGRTDPVEKHKSQRSFIVHAYVYCVCIHHAETLTHSNFYFEAFVALLQAVLELTEASFVESVLFLGPS